MARTMRLTAILSLAGTLLLSALYRATSGGVWLSLAITCGTVAYHIIMRLLVGLAFSAGMQNRANYTSRWYQVSRREMAVYEKLKVKRWKRGMPTYDPSLFDPRTHTWEEIVQATCQAELVHETIAVLSFLPIAAGVLVLNIFTNILSHFVQNTSDRLPLAGVAVALLALASAVSLLVVLAICFFIEIQQFYRLLGERGYLMLALPVPIWQHIAAKVICGTVWTLFGMVFFTLCGMLTTDTVSGSGFALDFSRVTAEDVAIWSAMLLIILALIAGALLHAYLACAFAAQFTQQRLLISIAAYFVIGFIGQMAALVTAVFVAFRGYKYLNNTGFSAASFFGPDNTLGVIVLTLLAVFALIALVDALLWALTQWLMTKRLNLA